MPSYKVVGATPLKGTIRVSGRKNAALPVIAATLLTTANVTIKNVPEISDVAVLLDILTQMGAAVTRKGKVVTVSTKDVRTADVPIDLARQLRGSVLLLGPLVARLGECKMPHPGGCIIGKRPVGLHFDILKALGAVVTGNSTGYKVTAKKLIGNTVFLPEASVTATENALMAAVVARGTTNLINVATEDHVTQLAEMLIDLGYVITGLGTSDLTVDGTAGKISDRDLTITIIPDELELGTFITAAVVTGGDVTITNVGTNRQTIPIRSIFTQFGVKLDYNERKQTVRVRGKHNLVPTYVKTGTWPGVPTDLQPPLALLATQIDGNTMIHDWMYEGRFSYVSNLIKMGADIITCDPHRILVHGPTPLFGTKTTSPDLRAGATQLIGALAAKGESIIDHAEIIERGYEEIVERLQNLGADIERLEG